MSVLQSLKGTFQNVQQDIVDGFRALGALDSTTRQRKLMDLEMEGISVDAGADLLYRYHEDWSQTMAYTSQSAHRAQEVDHRVRTLFMAWERRGHSANQLEEEAAILPTIASTLKDMLEVIESLCEDFRAVEEELDRLGDVREEEEVRREQVSHHAQLSSYRKTRQADAVAVKKKLWKKLWEKRKEMEEQKVEGRKGRGHSIVVTEMDNLSPPLSHNLSEETQPSADGGRKHSSAGQSHNALDDVLSSDEGEHAEGSSGEGAFIEDDYILDYSTTGEHHHPHPDHHPDLFPEIDDSPINFDDPAVCDSGHDDPPSAAVTEACEKNSSETAENDLQPPSGQQ